jgi:tRNA (pseudouridine54-N1)-methyltransferase
MSFTESFEETLEKYKDKRIFVLDSKGKDVKNYRIAEDAVFVLGDDVGLPPGVRGEKISIGPKSYIASHCISFINLHLDRSGL